MKKTIHQDIPIAANILGEDANECVYLHQKDNHCLIYSEIVSDKNVHENNDNMELDKNIDISEKEKDEVIKN